MSVRVERVVGNREVPRLAIRRQRAHVRGALSEVCPEEEGGSQGKHSFPRATKPKAEEAAA